MNINENVVHFSSVIEEGVKNNSFVKISLGNYKGSEENLKNIYIKKVLIKNEEKLSFTYHYKTRDIVKNYSLQDSLLIIQKFLLDGFYVATLFTTVFDLHYEKRNNDKINIYKGAATITKIPSLDHDRSKSRLITSKEKPYFFQLGITDEAGNVLKNSQDKYKQINHYIEILSALLKEIPAEKLTKVVDMGSGKGYLTFALYDYLANTIDVHPQITGVEMRDELVELCNRIAKSSNFEKLNFIEGSIEKYDSTGTNILIALHACDTATDDAIYKGITAQAELIVVAPCCHKQIRRQIEKNKIKNEVDFLTKYGIFLERQAEMVTDGIRAMILEYFGYKTKILEFITDAHTHKNIMIIGTKNLKAKLNDEVILQKIKSVKKYFGIEYHHLERLMNIE